MLGTLPPIVRSLYPFSYRTARAGLTPTAALVVDAFGGAPGMATEQVVNTLNDMRMRTGATRLMDQYHTHTHAVKRHKSTITLGKAIPVSYCAMQPLSLNILSLCS